MKSSISCQGVFNGIFSEDNYTPIYMCMLLFYRDQYSETLTQQWVGVFNGIFSEDNYTPIYIQDELEFVSVITQFPFHDEELKNVS